MSNSFSSNALLKGQGIYAVVKGDTPGHEFRGNQYTEGTGKLSSRADDVADRANDEGASKSIAAEHRSIAEGHKSIATELADLAAKMPLTQAEKPLVAKAAIDNFKAFMAHANAADAHEEAAKALANDPHSESALDAVEAAQRTSDDAATASAEAHGGTSIAANSVDSAGSPPNKSSDPTLTASGHRPLSTIASEIRSNWTSQKGGIFYGAKPYLAAMSQLNDIKDKYGLDSARSIVSYFLANASSWKGDKAREIKAELKKISNTPGVSW